MTETRAEAIERTARELLDALDRMYGNLGLSQNVIEARGRLRELIPRRADPRDLARKAS
jgi:hypothetical protein